MRGIGMGLAEHPGVGAAQCQAGGAAGAKRRRGAKITFHQPVQRDMRGFPRPRSSADAAADCGDDAATRTIEGVALIDDVDLGALGRCGRRRACSDRQRPSRGIER